MLGILLEETMDNTIHCSCKGIWLARDMVGKGYGWQGILQARDMVGKGYCKQDKIVW